MANQINPTDYKHRLAASFDLRSNYDDDYTVSRATQLVESARLKNGQVVLDLATGTGIVALLAARAVGAQGNVVGVDISPGMIDQARKKMTAEGWQNIELIEADLETLSFEDESFDAILCSSAFMWLTDIPATLRKCRAWLKTGGLLAFSCYSESSFMIPLLVRACARFGISLPNCNQPLGTPERCRELVKAAGFDRIEIQTRQFGSYLRRDDVAWRWDSESPWIDPRGDPLADLSAERLRELRTAYESELDALAGAQGLWHEITMFMVMVRK